MTSQRNDAMAQPGKHPARNPSTPPTWTEYLDAAPTASPDFMQAVEDLPPQNRDNRSGPNSSRAR